MLAELLPEQAFTLLLVFVRIGTALMLLPGFGESYISPRIRLLVALTLTVVVQPALPAVFPALPESAMALFLLIFGEAFIGLFIGSVARLLMAALSIGGMMIATVTGLANALTNAQHLGDFKPEGNATLEEVMALIKADWSDRQAAPIGYLSGLPRVVKVE